MIIRKPVFPEDKKEDNYIFPKSIIYIIVITVIYIIILYIMIKI